MTNGVALVFGSFGVNATTGVLVGVETRLGVGVAGIGLVGDVGEAGLLCSFVGGIVASGSTVGVI